MKSLKITVDTFSDVVDISVETKKERTVMLKFLNSVLKTVSETIKKHPNISKLEIMLGKKISKSLKPDGFYLSYTYIKEKMEVINE